MKPHRGVMILVFAILSLVMGCFPLGIAAWIMGGNDLKEMRAGAMDPTGEGLTNAGRIIGIIGTVLFFIGMCGYGILAVTVLSSVQHMNIK